MSDAQANASNGSNAANASTPGTMQGANAPTLPTPSGVDAADLVRAIEAIVMVATEPVPPEALAQQLEQSVATVEALCARLAEAYEEAGHGFILAQVAGGYRYQTHPAMAPYVERFVLEGQRARMSAAALETLAIVAYKQPISRAQVASIRGVDPDGVLRTLQGRGYVDQVGRDPGPGQAVLWGTTPAFLEKLGINSVNDLPKISEFVPGADVVEALEVGLRVTPTAPPIPPAAPPSTMSAIPATPENPATAGEQTAPGESRTPEPHAGGDA